MLLLAGKDEWPRNPFASAWLSRQMMTKLLHKVQLFGESARIGPNHD